jgi:ribonuclease-3
MSNYDEIKLIEENNRYEKPIISNNMVYKNVADFNKGEYLIYNEYNEEVSIEFVENILNKYGVKHKISDENLIKNAFVSKTYSKEYYIKGYNKYGNGNIAFKKAFNLITKDIKDNKKKCLELRDISNERLEWFGDAKLSEIISPYLEHRYPNEDEGFLTKIRSKLIRKQTLAELGMKLGLNKYILMSKQIEVYEECRTSVDLTEDCFEALIGSLSKEFKQQKCEYKLTQFLINLYEEEIDFVNIIVTDDNYKTKLMEHYHKIVNKTPYYQEEDTDENLCKVNVYEPVNKQIIGHGTDKIKKKAEQIAARNALIYLRLL